MQAPNSPIRSSAALQLERLAIPDVLTVTPRRHVDRRGYFSETFSTRTFWNHGITDHFVQDNHSFSASKATVRGLHFQRPPHAQAKLVRVTRGSVYDVAVDLRVGSPDFGRFVAAVLSAGNGVQLFVPVGFAHGFCTLEDGTDVVYKVSNFYSPEHDANLLWNDPVLAIPWPLEGRTALLSDKDAEAPPLSELSSPFSYQGDCV